MKRPLSMTILSLYMLVVSGIATVSGVFSAARSLPPYSSTQWLMLLVPSVLAVAAGFALWRMLRIGAWLGLISVALGWFVAIQLKTGFYPSLTTASVISVAIVAASLWVLATNWRLLRPLNNVRHSQEAAE